MNNFDALAVEIGVATICIMLLLAFVLYELRKIQNILKGGTNE